MVSQQTLLDMDFAMSQLGGNAEMLSRMLGKFYTEFVDSSALIKELLDQEKISEAKLKVHTIKGLSGNLGLKALYQSSKEFDAQLRDGIVDKQKFSEFSSVMAATCEYLKNQGFKIHTHEVPSTNQSSNNEYLEEFKARLERREFIDDDSLNKYIGSLDIDHSTKQTLMNLVEELQYDKALKLIEAI